MNGWKLVTSNSTCALVQSQTGRRLTLDDDEFYRVILLSAPLFDRFWAWFDGGASS